MNMKMQTLETNDLLVVNGGGVGLFVVGTIGGILASAANPAVGATIILATWGITCDQAGY